MAIFRRKDGEKAALLSKCGESLFGCSGELLPTQGIYAPKLSASRPFHFICKRTVWVPLSLSHEHLVQHLESFCATLPFPVQRAASLHRFGLCGIYPTRTIHAFDKHFLLLAKIPHKYFAVFGIVEISELESTGVVCIENLSTNKNDVLDCVDWIKSEFSLYKLSKRARNKRNYGVQTEKSSDKEGQMIASESEPSTVVQRTQQGQIQYRSDETESEVSTNTPEYLNNPPSEQMNPQNIIVSGVHFPDQSTVYWIPCLPIQNTAEITESQNPFFISP